MTTLAQPSSQPPLPSAGTCPKCRSTAIMKGLHILDRDESVERDLSIRVEKEPGSIIFRDYKDFRFLANICAGCGFTELYVENFKALAKSLGGPPEAGKP